MLPEQTDVLLVGAGPIGIEIAAELKKHDIDYVHIESGNVASTIEWYSPGTSIFSSPERLAIAGIPFSVYPAVKATREDYLNYLRGVVRGLGLVIHQQMRLVNSVRIASHQRSDVAGSVTEGIHSEGSEQPNPPTRAPIYECEIVESDWAVGGPEYRSLDEFSPTREPIEGKPGSQRFEDKSQGCVDRGQMKLKCRRIVLAVGDMHLPRQVNMLGESNRNVSHFLPDIHSLFGKRVVIVGAKNSAAEAIVRLARFNDKITLVHRGDALDPARIKPWLLPEIRSLIIDGRIRFHPRSVIEKAEGRKLTIKQLDSGDTEQIDFDRLLLLTGYDQDSTLFERLKLELDGEGRVPKLNLQTMQSSDPNIYIAGTATAGSQRGGTKVFIENCHIHSKRIVESLLGRQSTPLQHSDRDEFYREL